MKNQITVAEAKQIAIQRRKEINDEFFTSQLNLIYDKINKNIRRGYLHCDYYVPSMLHVDKEEFCNKIKSSLKENGFSFSHIVTSYPDYCLTISWT